MRSRRAERASASVFAMACRRLFSALPTRASLLPPPAICATVRAMVPRPCNDAASRTTTTRPADAHAHTARAQTPRRLCATSACDGAASSLGCVPRRCARRCLRARAAAHGAPDRVRVCRSTASACARLYGRYGRNAHYQHRLRDSSSGRRQQWQQQPSTRTYSSRAVASRSTGRMTRTTRRIRRSTSRL